VLEGELNVMLEGGLNIVLKGGTIAVLDSKKIAELDGGTNAELRRGLNRSGACNHDRPLNRFVTVMSNPKQNSFSILIKKNINS
jgi:hypothetical protein